MPIKKGKKLYEGKAKIVFATSQKDYYIQYFKDDATAFDGKKKGVISEKGICNNKISCHLFTLLKTKGIPTHFVEQLDDRAMLVKKLDIVKVEVIVRNIAAGSLCSRLGMTEGDALKSPVLEYCYKSDALHDPQINLYHVLAMGLATKKQMQQIDEMALKINKILQVFFKNADWRW